MAVLAASVPVADAGIFSRKEKPSPSIQVMELLKTLKNNPSTGERSRAAEDLRDFDAQAFPEIVPALINALQNDSSSSVRRQAAESLGKIRPTSVEAQQALEQAEKQDDSMLVRWKARTALLGYRVDQPPPAAVQAAPFGQPQAAPVVRRPQVPSAPVVRVVPPTSSPPPVAQQPTRRMPLPPPEGPKLEVPSPAPPPATASGPILEPRTASPASLARPVPKTAPTPADDGPILIAPKNR
jgi:hypothetical protein